MNLRSRPPRKISPWASNIFRRLKTRLGRSSRRLWLACAGAAAAVLLAAIASVSFGLLLWGLLLPAAVIVNVEVIRRYRARLQSAIRALRESEEKFRCVVENAQDAIVVASAREQITYWNKAAERIFGYTKSEAACRSPHEILCPSRYREKASKEYAQFAASGYGQKLNIPVRIEALRKDGTEFPVEILISGYSGKGGWNSVTSIRDVSERKRTVAELEHRSNLLQAISAAASTLLTSTQLDEAMGKVLGIIGNAVGADGVRVFLPQRFAGARFHYSWRSPTAPASLNPASPNLWLPENENDPVLTPLRGLGTVMEISRTLPPGPVKTLCENLGVLSFLILPIVVDGDYRGRLALGDCKAEREWSQSEIDALRTIADMIGASLVREHYVQELEDAKRIIEGSATILFRLRGEPSLPLIYVSHNIAQLGYSAEELIASPRLTTDVVHPHDRPAMREVLMRALAEGEAGSLEFRVLSRDGCYRWFESHYKPLHDAYGRLIEIEGVMMDVTQRKDLEQKIALLARTDPLTGVANRAAFIDRLRQAFTASKRGAKPFAVLYIDLDHFKDVNDTLGHSAGDILLKAAVGRL